MSGWLGALAGGVLIGLSATLLLWLNGRIAGISGMLGAVAITPQRGQVAWRVLFLLGMVAAATAWMSLVPGAAQPRTGLSPVLLIAAGLLVGFGSRMGNGCTSGHGVCGLGRLSWRSLAAVMTFMVTAIGTTFVVRHVVGG